MLSIAFLFLVLVAVQGVVEATKTSGADSASYLLVSLLAVLLLGVDTWLLYLPWRHHLGARARRAFGVFHRRRRQDPFETDLLKGRLVRADWVWYVPHVALWTAAVLVGVLLPGTPGTTRDEQNRIILLAGATLVLFYMTWFPWSIKVRLWPDRLEWRTVTLKWQRVRYEDIDHIEQVALLGFGAAKVWWFHLRTGGKRVGLGGVNGLGSRKRSLILRAIRTVQPSVRVRRENWRGEVSEK